MTKRYYGEEAELLTPTEMMAHNTRMVQAQNGTYDILAALVPAPTSKPDAEVI